MSEQPQRLFLIDGSSYIYRAYFAIRHLSNSQGMATNAIYGFTNMLLKVIRELKPDQLAVIFDSKGPTFRKEIYPDYKANRAAMPEDLVPQIPYIKRIVQAFNLPGIEMPGYEADDIIATLAKKFSAEGMDVTVVTGDKDLMQIVDDHIQLLDTMKDKVYGPAEVAERFGGADKVVEVQALSGDSSDNIPGVPGIGEKTAKMLIDEFGDVETLLANLDQLKGKRRENLENYADLARLSKKLVTLVDNLDLEVDDHAFTLAEPDREALTELFKECEFYKLLQEFSIDTKNRAESAGYLVVLTESDLDELVAALEQSERFAFDTETTSLDAMRADLVGLSFAVTAGEAWYVPVGHHYLGMPEQLPLDRVLEAVRPLLASPRQLKIGQNLKYDILVLARAGIEVSGPIYDTMLASYLANPATRSHGMDNLAAELLNYHTISYSEVAGSGKKQIGFEEVEVEKATTYAAEDADITLRLYEKLVPMVTEQHQDGLLNDVEMPLLQILAGMERAGIRINPEFLGGLSADMEKKLAVLETEIHQLAGGPFNIGSPKQLGEVLFENLGLPKGKKTKTGWSTDVEVLNKLAEDHEIAAKILDYRSLMKLKGTYTDALPKLIHPETGRIHTSFNQAVTATGRLSSSDPNLQNIPIRTEEGRRIREGFIPSDGCVLLSADYSQVELRILAHMADEPALKEAFARGEDIHRSTASEVLGLFPEMVTDEQRRAAKAINFGVVYGISAFGLAKQLGINRREAQQFIDTYFERYPGIRTFMDACIAEAREKMYVTTLLGRRCAIPEINSKNGAVRGYAERNAINYPVQGSAADIIKVAMVKIAARLAKEGLQARMLLQVHDELVFDVPQAELEKVSALVKSEMQGAVDLSVPLLVEVGSGRNWREAH
ncbi:MAG: DNA polymerase I [Deltaproteobacteria bacterium]|jgi:DNA polymerase-1|nr:DNA polymerase I [Deltaproteobacteria bacterium]